MEDVAKKEGISKLYTSEYFPFLIFGLAIFLLVCRVNLLSGDDIYFQTAISQQGAFSWLKQRYLTWSGRMSSDLTVVLMNFNLLGWKILNSTVAALMMLCTSKFATATIEQAQTRRWINIILCCSFFGIYPYVITSSVIWYTGSFNYLWPTTAFLCALIPFYYEMIEKKTVYVVTYYIYFVAAIYASYVEQTVAVLLCFGIFVLFYLKLSKRKVSKYLWIHYLVILVNGAVCLASPGTVKRAGMELHWYPDYPMLTMVDKVFQSINWTNKHLLTASNLLFLLFTLLIFGVCYKKYRDSSKLICFFSAIPLIFTMFRIIPFNSMLSRVANFQHGITDNIYQPEGMKSLTYNMEKALDKMFFDPTLANPSNLNTGLASLLPSVFCMTIILFIGVLLLLCFDTMRQKLACSILYFAAVTSGYIMAFSPTIFASGSRIFFVTDILILLLIGTLLGKLFTYDDIKDSRYMIKGTVVLILIAGMIIIQYLADFYTYLPWL